MLRKRRKLGKVLGAVILCLMMTVGYITAGSAQEISSSENLERRLLQQEALIQKQQAMIEALTQKMDLLERKVQSQPAAASASSGSSGRVSLSGGELSSLSDDGDDAQVLARPWYKNIRMDGFGAGGFVMSGGEAVRQKGSFLNYEATLNVDAQVWEDVSFFSEIQTIRLADENTKWARTGEVYVHFHDVMKSLFNREGMGIGAKIGRADIPVGEDYLTQDVIDNPLITFSAAFPYGWDEGLVLYGGRGLKWIFAVMDGSDTRGTDDNNDKFVSLKFYGDAMEDLYLSASVFRNGRSSKSAWEYGGTHMLKVGSGGFNSALGTSPSSTVHSMGYELDARYDLGDDRYVKLQYGSAFLDDEDNADFSRNIHYFQVEPKWNLGSAFENKWYLVGRFSAVGTFNDDKGFVFDGKPYAGGESAFGYDVKALYRYAAGLGFRPNPRTLIKMEYSWDDFRLISASRKDGGREGRDLAGIIATVKF